MSSGLQLPDSPLVLPAPATHFFRGEFSSLDDDTKKLVLGLFDPVRDDMKQELMETVKELGANLQARQRLVEEGKQEEDQEIQELARRIEELGAGAVKEVEDQELTRRIEKLRAGAVKEVEEEEGQEDQAIQGQRIFAANSMQVILGRKYVRIFMKTTLPPTSIPYYSELLVIVRNVFGV